MELRDLEYFAMVAEHGNLRRAAAALGLSQPALSKSLHRLEDSAQAKLVKRTTKGVELTAVGSALLAHSRRLRLSLDEIGREVADLSQGRAGHLRLGANQFAVDRLLKEACTALIKTAPGMTWTVTLAQNDALVPGLRNGAYDLIVSGVPVHPEQDLVQEHLIDDEFVVVVSANHRLAKQKKVALADLTGYRWALSGPGTLALWEVERAFREHGLPSPQVTLRTNASDLLRHAVASSDLLGFQSRRHVRQRAPHIRLVELPVKELRWIRRLGVTYRKDAYLSPAAKRFIEILKETVRKLG